MVAMDLPPDKPHKLYQKIANAVADAIKKGTYVHGQRLPSERDLAEEFQVSRPTVREAMIALEMRGYVEARQGSGVYVTKPSPSTIIAEVESAPELDIGAFELTEARRLFEGETAALAASVITDPEIAVLENLLEQMEDKNSRDAEADRADRQFHVTIAQATQNSAIVTVIENLWDIRYDSPLCRAMLARAAIARPVAAEHRSILDALKARDPQRARNAMRAHLAQVIDGLFKATELESLERAKSDVEAKRSEFARRSSI